MTNMHHLEEAAEIRSEQEYFNAIAGLTGEKAEQEIQNALAFQGERFVIADRMNRERKAAVANTAEALEGMI